MAKETIRTTQENAMLHHEFNWKKEVIQDAEKAAAKREKKPQRLCLRHFLHCLFFSRIDSTNRRISFRISAAGK